MQSLGFTHLVILDTESRRNPKGQGSPVAYALPLLRALLGKPPALVATVTTFADAASPMRQFCDANLASLIAKPHTILYSIAPPPSSSP